MILSTVAPEETKTRYELRCRYLPLVVYREIAAHLRQVEGVDAGLLPQTTTSFDYRDSQAGGLWIQFEEAATAESRETVDRILAYYSDRHGSWESVSSQRMKDEG